MSGLRASTFIRFFETMYKRGALSEEELSLLKSVTMPFELTENMETVMESISYKDN